MYSCFDCAFTLHFVTTKLFTVWCTQKNLLDFYYGIKYFRLLKLMLVSFYNLICQLMTFTVLYKRMSVIAIDKIQ